MADSGMIAFMVYVLCLSRGLVLPALFAFLPSHRQGHCDFRAGEQIEQKRIQSHKNSQKANNVGD